MCVCMHTHMHTHTHTHVCTYTHARAHTHTHTHTYSACNSGSQNASDKDNIQSTASTPARTGRTPGKSVCVCVCVSTGLPLPLPTLPSPSHHVPLSLSCIKMLARTLAHRDAVSHVSSVLSSSLEVKSHAVARISLSLSLSLSLCGAARHSLIHRYGVDWHAGRAPCSTAPAAPARRRRRKRKQVRGLRRRRAGGQYQRGTCAAHDSTGSSSVCVDTHTQVLRIVTLYIVDTIRHQLTFQIFFFM